MAGQRQPTDLVVMKGKKHFTKAEIEARKKAEIVAPSDKIEAPQYLSAKQKKIFGKIAGELIEIKLLANIDCDALARLVIAQEQYVEITKMIRKTPLMIEVPIYETQVNTETGKEEQIQSGSQLIVNGERERLMIIQDRCMKQCRQGAGDFGMTVSSRCRLAVPQGKEEIPENRFSKYAT